MKPISASLSVALLGAGLLLTGCASHPARPGAAPAGQPQASPESHPASTTRSSESRGESHAGHGTRRAATSSASPTPAGKTAELPESTGIPACDDYLASYVSCHRAAGVYKPDEIPGRYEAMRTSLLRDSQDPAIRPNLAARCNSLASQLRKALHGKSCEGAPAAASSQAGN